MGLVVPPDPEGIGDAEVRVERVAENTGVSLAADCGSSAIGLSPRPAALVVPLLKIEIVMFPGTPLSSGPVNHNSTLHAEVMVVVESEE